MIKASNTCARPREEQMIVAVMGSKDYEKYSFDEAVTRLNDLLHEKKERRREETPAFALDARKRVRTWSSGRGRDRGRIQYHRFHTDFNPEQE